MMLQNISNFSASTLNINWVLTWRIRLFTHDKQTDGSVSVIIAKFIHGRIFGKKLKNPTGTQKTGVHVSCIITIETATTYGNEYCIDVLFSA